MGGGKLRGVEVGETMIRIYCVAKHKLFNKRKTTLIHMKQK